jgi:hypothetical protein
MLADVGLGRRVEEVLSEVLCLLLILLRHALLLRLVDLANIDLELLTEAILVFLVVILKGLSRGKPERIAVLRLQEVILDALDGRLVGEVGLIAHLAETALVGRLIEGNFPL